MSSRIGGNFFTAHYDWLAAGAAVLALAGAVVFFTGAIKEDAEAKTAAAVRRIESRKPDSSGVKPADMEWYTRIVKLAKAPLTMNPVNEKGGSFLASDRRIFCAKAECHAPIPPSAKVCPYCNEPQPEEQAPAVLLDADGDGLPDDWERKYGLSPNDQNDADADFDGDGFTNAEEFAANTDPTDRNDHPDYLDSVKIALPLRETALPFFLRSYQKIPAGMKLDLFDPKKRNDYGTLGKAYPTLVGQDVGDTGFSVKSFEHKEKKVKIAGGGGAVKTVDVSYAVIVRKSDGKEVNLLVASQGKPKRVPVDVQARILYERGGTKEFVVVAGDTIDLNGTKYSVKEIKRLPNGASVTFEHSTLGKSRTLEALEQ